MQACRLEKTSYTPVWLMRQAGRYMPEYRAIREKVAFLELCKNSALSAEVTVMAVNQLGVDAAIIFADILLPLEAMGVGLEYAKGDGPVIRRPVKDMADVESLRKLDVDADLGFVFESVRLARKELPKAVPLIGFAGAPFTMASYVIEGGSSRHFEKTKAMMYRQKDCWTALMNAICGATVEYLNGQIRAGAQVVQLFDSWVGCLGYDDYLEYVLPHTARVIAGISPGVPVIHFATGTSALLQLMRDAGGDVIGVDWRMELAEAWRKVGHDRAIQGNLDPVLLLADRDEIRRRATRVLKYAEGRPGHIFNLGHGVLPNTPVDNARFLVELVHELSSV